MGWYGRSKLALVASSTASKIVSKSKTPISSIKNHPHNTSPIRITSFSPASKRVLGCPHSAFTGIISRRCYYADNQQVRHFKRRGLLAHPPILFAMLVVGAGTAICVYYGIFETIPYTKRKHFLLISPVSERRVGETSFRKIKATWSGLGKTLPPEHPECVRIRRIAGNIVLALHRGLRKDKSWTDFSFPNETMAAESVKQDEILDDDKWKHGSSGKKGSDQYAIGHLQGLNWEVLVVNVPIVNAVCLSGGKIIVFAGLIQLSKTDAELATVIGHEVAHAVARHSAERLTKSLWVDVVKLLLFPFVSTGILNEMPKYLLTLPFSRRMELEADYIGLLLMASAGYDPRVAPLMCEKMEKLSAGMAFENYRSTHPSWKTRAKMLSDAKVMQEALDIYREAMAGREVEGFFL